MNANEKDIIEKIASSSKDIEVPESLKPDAVCIRLEALESSEEKHQSAKDDGDATNVQKISERKFRKWKRMPAAMAACLAILCGVGLLATGLATSRSHEGGLSPWATSMQESGSSETSQSDANLPEGVSAVQTASSYQQLYDLLKSSYDSTEVVPDIPISGLTDTTEESSTSRKDSTNITENSDMATASSETGDFSKTNIRTEGVDEGDIVKTDGNVICSVQDWGEQIDLVKADDGKMRKVATIDVKDIAGKNGYISDIYIENGRLWVIADTYNSIGRSWVPVTAYDIADPSNPKVIGSTKQAGYYHNSRMVDGYLYLFTSYSPAINFKQEKVSTYIPNVDGEPIACSDIYVPDCEYASSYFVMGSIDVQEPDKFKQTKAMLAGTDDVYVSNDSIYLYGMEYDPRDIAAQSNELDESDDVVDSSGAAIEPALDVALSYSPATGNTLISKLSYSDGSFTPVGETSVQGTIDDGFSIDEYEGNTRIVTTSYDENGKTSNNVFILDKDMKLIGSLTDIAPGESVYSARLMGNVGYFVTYREVDPLFSVDLSDPTNPKIIGQLKIPGFSEYLHPWGDGRMLGIGYSTNKKGTITNGIKLTMFDTSDPSNVRELHTFVLKGYLWSVALYDHRAVYADIERGLVGFSTEDADSTYYLFSYTDEKGFSKVMTDKLSHYESTESRGLRISDDFYVVGEGFIDSYNMNGFKRIDSIKL